MAKGEKVTFAFSVPSATSAWVHGSTWLQEPECKLTGGVEWRERFREATKGCDIRILLYFPDNSPPCISIPHEFLGTQDSEFPIFAALNTSRVWAGLCLYPDCRQSCWPVHLSLHCTAGVAICRGRCSGVSTHIRTIPKGVGCSRQLEELGRLHLHSHPEKFGVDSQVCLWHQKCSRLSGTIRITTTACRGWSLMTPWSPRLPSACFWFTSCLGESSVSYSSKHPD